MIPTYKPTVKHDGIVIDEIMSGGHMLVGGKPQDIHEQSTIQNYDIGTRLVMDDRVFRYAKAGDVLTAINGGRCTNFPQEGETDAVAYVVGAYQITIPMNPNADNYTAEQVANYWAEGYIWVQQWPQVTGIGELYRIKSSAAASGGFVTLTLYRPLTVLVPESNWITAWPNLYQNVKTASDARMSVVCVPLIPVASGSWFWGQTWGPIFMSSGAAPGRGDHERDVYFNPTVSSPGQQGVNPATDVDFHTENNPIPQRAGFIITNTNEWEPAGGGTELGGDGFIMLQISP